MQLKQLLKLTSLLLLLCASTSVLAQKSLNKVKNAPLHAGDARTFEQPMETLIKYSRSACTEAGLVIESSERIDERSYMIMAKAKVSAFSWGEIVRVFIQEKEDETESVVRVYTRKRIGMNLAAKASYTNTIFSNVESKIEFGD